MPFYNNMPGFPQQPYYNGAVPDRLAQLSGQYQPQQLQPMQTVQPMQQPAGNGIIWVQGEEGAKAYLTAPGASVIEYSVFERHGEIGGNITPEKRATNLQN